MIELVFVIVILGILAAVAIPKLAATRDDAMIAKGRANILAIRSGIIAERQGRMFRGDSAYAATLDGGTKLFERVLTEPVASKSTNGGWTRTDATHYNFHVMNQAVIFEYNTSTGRFFCSTTTGTAIQKELCANLTQ